jgi:hypothetical protein
VADAFTDGGRHYWDLHGCKYWDEVVYEGSPYFKNGEMEIVAEFTVG